MPWHKVHHHAECPDGKPWAVVKDADGTVAGCHASETDADQQLAALYASEQDGASTVETDTLEATTATVNQPDVASEPLVAAAPKKAPPKKTNDDSQCPEGSRQLPDGSCVSEDEYAVMSAWHGVLCVEGITTGDGREFAPDALSWAEQPLLRWQKESAHGGQHDVTVSVGRIDRVWRVGNQIMGEGVIDLESVDGFEIHRRLGNGFAGGISIDADDIQDADVEFIWGDEPDGTDEADPLMILFAAPEKMIFHGGRVRAATLVDIPAFVEARIQLGVREDSAGELVASGEAAKFVAAVHQTETSDEPWDGSTFGKRLPNILPLEVAREAYAFYGEQSNGRVPKTSCRYLHHEVDEDGKPGPANLTACAAAIAELRTADGHKEFDRQYVYAHLAAHLRDAGQEPPPLEDQDVVTAAVVLNEWRPERTWFANPELSVPTGITVTDEGRVYGHAAQWGECHIGYTDQCVTLPRENDHPYFMTGELLCADGTRVAVGQITVGTGHAPLTYRASHAAEHYDNTGAAVADVTVGNDQFGIWIAGAIRASVAASRVHELRASGQVSGDWRRIGGQLRLVGLLAVNVPGFPVPRPRARVASGSPLSLVAAGRTTVARDLILPTTADEPVVVATDDELNQQAMRRVMQMLMMRVRPMEEASTHV